MIQIVPRNLGAAGYIIILQLVIIAFFGVLFIGTQLQSIDIKQIAIQNQETANDTNEILKGGTNIQKIVNELRNISSAAEESRQNQTKVLLPLFQRQFTQVDGLVNTTNDLRILLPVLNESINNVTASIVYLSENFGQGSDYLERENFQYQQANDTHKILQEIRGILNSSS